MSGWGRLGFTTGDLLPLLPAQPGVCDVCFQWTGGGTRCHSCRECLDAVAVSRTFVLPIALAVKQRPLASTLWQYKDSEFEQTRATAASRLRGLLAAFLPRHEECLATRAGTAGFDVVTWIPSSRGRTHQHPLRALLSSSTWASTRLVEGLRLFNSTTAPHEAAADKFSANPAFEGRRVLVVDDTWTRGANALSAAHAVKKRRAAAVSVVVLGRHFDPGYSSCATYANAATDLGFNYAYCVYCDTRPDTQRGWA